MNASVRFRILPRQIRPNPEAQYRYPAPVIGIQIMSDIERLCSISDIYLLKKLYSGLIILIFYSGINFATIGYANPEPWTKNKERF